MLLMVFAGFFLFAYVYRLSELFGFEAMAGCRLAILLSAVSGLAGMLPMVVTKARKINNLIISVLIGASARSLCALAGVVIVELVLVPSGLWFLGFALLFYFIFLVFETYLAVSLFSTRSTVTIGVNI